jgi:hypothetical protein
MCLDCQRPLFAAVERILAARLTDTAPSIVCRDYPDCKREHAGGAGGVPVHPPEGARISGTDGPLIPDTAAPEREGLPSACRSGDCHHQFDCQTPAAPEGEVF